jgi:hypothetical protein
MVSGTAQNWTGRTWMLVVAALIGAVLSGCGGGDSDASDPVGEAGTSGAADVSDTTGSAENTSSEEREYGTTISGSFRGVPEEQYTVEVSYSLADLGADVLVADVPPGEAIVAPSAEADVEIANTTPQRNTMIGTPHMYITLLYEESGVPTAAIDGTTQLLAGDWYETCQFRHAGQVYCGLGEFAFGLALGQYDAEGDVGVPVELSPSESITVPQGLEPRGLVVREESAEAVASFIRSRPPDLVLVNPGDVEVGIACEFYVRDDVHPAVAHERFAVALLDGDGRVIHQPPLEGSSVPIC